jgi:hypothetical protein
MVQIHFSILLDSIFSISDIALLVGKPNSVVLIIGALSRKTRYSVTSIDIGVGTKHEFAHN